MLPTIIFAYRTSVHSSTSMSPFELLYGRKPRLVLTPIPMASQVMHPADWDMYLERMLARRALLTEHARDNIAKAQRSQKEGHDKRVKFTRELKIGDLVAYRKEKRNEKKGKFRAKFTGPYLIIGQDEHRKKSFLKPARQGVETNYFVVPNFELIPCMVDMDLTNINISGDTDV